LEDEYNRLGFCKKTFRFISRAQGPEKPNVCPAFKEKETAMKG
jgi:hypothetical protein